MHSLAVASRPRPSEAEWIVKNYGRLRRSSSRVAPSVDHTDPSIALRKHCVGRKITRFAKVNVCKGDLFLRNRINSTCMLFFSMYTLIMLTIRLCAHRNSCPKRGSDTHKHPAIQTAAQSEDLIHTNIHPPKQLPKARIWYTQTSTHPNSCPKRGSDTHKHPPTQTAKQPIHHVTFLNLYIYVLELIVVYWENMIVIGYGTKPISCLLTLAEASKTNELLWFPWINSEAEEVTGTCLVMSLEDWGISVSTLLSPILVIWKAPASLYGNKNCRASLMPTSKLLTSCRILRL